MPDFKDHIWALVVCFLAAVTAYTVLGIVAPQAGTLLRAVVLGLGTGVVGFAGGRLSVSDKEDKK